MATGVVDSPGGKGNPKRIPLLPSIATIGGITPFAGPSQRRASCVAAQPLLAPSLVLWAKGDTGTNQTAGGLPSAIDNDPLGEWLDQSGNANNLVQATSGSRPSFLNNQVNGHPAVVFNGSSQSVTALFTLNIPFDLFAVVKQVTWVEGANLFSGGSGDDFTVEQHAATPRLYIWNGAALGGANSDLALGTWSLLEVGLPGLAAGNCYLKVNQNAATSGGGSALAARNGITLAAHPGPANFCNVAIAEIAVYNTILSGAFLAGVQSYFGTKYGLF